MENEKIITFEIPKGYKFKERLYNKFVFEKMNERPTNINEASEILGLGMFEHEHYRNGQLKALRELLLFRDAWWKMADDWKPTNISNRVTSSIYYNRVRDKIEHSCGIYEIFEFPTAEMRDAFHENFKDLIEICKELL